MSKTTDKCLNFKLSFDGTPDQSFPLAVHVFDASGKSLETQPVNTDGSFALYTDAADLKRAQIFVAPTGGSDFPLPKAPTPEDLLEVNAYQPVFQYDKRRLLPDLMPIPEFHWKDWYFCLCRVKGKVVKRFPSPTWPFFWQKRPIGHARVHICRLESLLAQVPDRSIFDIRDKIIKAEIPQLPIPFPEPTPFYGLKTAEMAHTHGMEMAKATVTTKSVEPMLLNASFKQQLALASVRDLRNLLSENITTLRAFPGFCWANFLYTCKEIAVVETDCNGLFDRTVWENCFRPNHDYYFWVEYLINGVWETVYRPSICDGAHWNYTCGSNAEILITDARVPAGCRPTLSGAAVEIVKIGSSGYVSDIKQPASQPTIANPDARAGLDLTNNDGLINWAGAFRPMGYFLPVYANFSRNLPNTEATHYKIMYRKSSAVGAWTSVNGGSFARSYTEEIVVGGIPHFVGKDFELLEPGTAEFYKITHELAEDQLGLNNNCIWAGDVYPIGVLDTRNLDNDWYDIKVELYRQNGANFELTNVDKTVWQMPDPSDSTESIVCPDNYLMQVTHGGRTAYAFRMTVRVDNQSCTSSIDDVLINDSGAGECGFLNYTAESEVAKLGFNANHPNNFATFDFRVVRGNNLDIESVSAHGGAVSLANVNGFDGSDAGVFGAADFGRHFVKNAKVSDLVAELSAGCAGKAAFAQRLYVYAMATDGTNRLGIYDASEKIAAFAIVKTVAS